MAAHFNVAPGYYNFLQFDNAFATAVDKNSLPFYEGPVLRSGFANRSPGDFRSYESAYYQLMYDIVDLQVRSLKLVLEDTEVKHILVDGNFSGNRIFMQMLANLLPAHNVYSTGIANASAIGAAMVIHDQWNKNPIPANLVQLQKIPSQLPSNL